MIPGIGTAVNVLTVLLGAGLGVLLGNRLPVRTRDVVTDALGLVTLLVPATYYVGQVVSGVAAIFVALGLATAFFARVGRQRAASRQYN